jgi:hypothetical protein
MTLTELLREHKTGDTLIETGTQNGRGVKAALDAGFTRVISFECNEARVSAARVLFGDRAQIIHARSGGPEFAEAVEALDGPATFWLDAHRMAGGGKIPDDYPLTAELDAIFASPHLHTILADDMRLWERYGTTPEKVKSQAKKRSKKYRAFLATIREEFPGDVMVLTVETEQET